MSNPLKALLYLFNGAVPIRLKLLFLLAGMGYFLFPIDLIPDFLLVAGQMDDLGVVGLAASMFVHAAESALAQRENLDPIIRMVQEKAGGIGCASTVLIVGAGIVLHLGILEIALLTIGGTILASKVAAEWYEGKLRSGDYVPSSRYLSQKHKNEPQPWNDDQEDEDDLPKPKR